MSELSINDDLMKRIDKCYADFHLCLDCRNSDLRRDYRSFDQLQLMKDNLEYHCSGAVHRGF